MHSAGVSLAPGPVGLGQRGRRLRLAATAVVLALTTAGTLWGQDDAFPFGPFRMYATRNSPSEPVASLRVDGVLPDGQHRPIADSATGLRRAEIEGQEARLIADPALLGLVAQAYARRNPGKTLAGVQIVERRYTLVHGERTGAYTDRVLAAWGQR